MNDDAWLELCGCAEEDFAGVADCAADDAPAAAGEAKLPPRAAATNLPRFGGAAPRRPRATETAGSSLRARNAFAGCGGADHLGPPGVIVVLDGYGGVALEATKSFAEGDTVLVEAAAAAAALGEAPHCIACFKSLANAETVFGADAEEVAEDWPKADRATDCEQCGAAVCGPCHARGNGPVSPDCCAARAVDATLVSADAAVRLGAKRFAAETCRALRRRPAGDDAPAAGAAEDGRVLDQLCGSESDAAPLGLGVDLELRRSLVSAVASAAGVGESAADSAAPSIDELKRFSAQFALNTFEVRPRSPFAACHANLARKHGRGTAALRKALQGVLDRGDSDVADRAAVRCAALFALASCANHSCQPSCEQSCDFETPTLELKARCALVAGDEITLSYFDPRAVCGVSAAPTQETKRRDAKRRRAYLERNYLFRCDCQLCKAQGAS